jgi:mono/diheme cytochrome c family protein
MVTLRRCFLLFWIIFLAVPLDTLAPLAAAEGDVSGEQVYRTICATCHGSQGEGTSNHERRLEGDRSIAQLAELIGKTMPEDDPGSLSEGQAAAVAAYVYDAFYSPIARARIRPARVELSRLTVRQHRMALADLVGGFRPPATVSAERGLNAEYYGGRSFREKNQAARRVDAWVNFDFGVDAPLPEISEPREFSVRWQGSLLAPDTGEYEFVVRTEHAARLWLNDMKEPLIYAWVKSGNDTEYRAATFLIGGRAYPLRLEFSKAKQGVDDSKEKKEQPPSAQASIALVWKRPQRVHEPVPTRHLSPGEAPESFACSTRFPPDDRSYGWERGTTISKAWDQAATDAAIEAAGNVASRANELAGTSDDAPDRAEKLRTFCARFAERAFRRPLTAEQARSLIDRQFEAAGDVEKAVKRVVVFVLKSPRFLYREVGGGPDAYDVASRLSFGLWDSIPDQELLAAAAEGRLAEPDHVAAQAERMIADPRAKAKLHAFLLTWLKADTVRELAKDEQQFPGFDANVAADLRTSLELFLDDVVWSDEPDFRRLLRADGVFLNRRLATFYGVELPPDEAGAVGADFVKVVFDPGRRAGAITHPYLMASFARSRESSPIHRGVFLVRGLLGRSLRPPPEAVTPLPPDLHPMLTTRERVTLQTQATACMTCHEIINPLGFTLEHFDAVGRYRELERDKPVDAHGVYQTRAGDKVTIHGARELAEFLAASDEAQAAFVEQLFHHLVGQSVQAYATALDDLRRSFAQRDFNIRKLVVDVLVASALTGRDTGLNAERGARNAEQRESPGAGAPNK